MRLFIALAPPAAALDHLDAAFALYRPARADLRWTKRELWHVTLAFLGEVREESLVKLEPRLERAARRHRAFALSVSGAGAFPNPARANVLWSGLAGDRRALAELAATVSAAARRAGAAPPDAGRRFRPHLTMARCRMPADVRPIVTALAGYLGPSWNAEAIYLIRSHLGGSAEPGDGPRYETLGSWPLLARGDSGDDVAGGIRTG